MPGFTEMPFPNILDFLGCVVGACRWLWWGLLTFLLVACGGTTETAVTPTPVPSQMPTDIVGDPVRGEALYQQRLLGWNGAPGCVTCHSLVADITLVGPSHYRLADRAANAVPDQSAAAYLWTSIVDPNAHITAGYAPGDMYGQYATELTMQEIADLVVYMLTLHE